MFAQLVREIGVGAPLVLRLDSPFYQRTMRLQNLGDTPVKVSFKGTNDAGIWRTLTPEVVGGKIEVLTGYNFIDFKEASDGAVFSCQILPRMYDPYELAMAIGQAMSVAGAASYTVTWDPVLTVFTIETDGSYLSILWNTGSHTAASIAAVLGFSTASNSTGDTAYTGTTVGSVPTWADINAEAKFPTYFTIDATNDKIDFKEASDGTELTATLAHKSYAFPDDLAADLTAALDAAGANTYSVTWIPSTRKFDIASNGAYLSVLWNTGTNTAVSVGPTIGFPTSGNSTGALHYLGTVRTLTAVVKRVPSNIFPVLGRATLDLDLPVGYAIVKVSTATGRVVATLLDDGTLRDASQE